MKRISLLIILALLISPVKALELGLAKEDGGHAGAFLDFAASARSLAMGRAHTAVADDAGATYWNPAGLTQLDQNDVVSLYSFLEDDSAFGYFSYARPFRKIGALGFSFVSLTSENIDKRNSAGGPLGEAEFSEMAVLVSHGYMFGANWSWGNTIKGVRQKIDIYNDTSFGWDTALMYRMGKNWQAGLTYKNVVAPKLTLKSQSDEFNRDLRLGLKWQPGEKFLWAADVNKTDDRGVKFNTGVEWNAHKNLTLRGGINETELTTGLGLSSGNWDLDYAFGYNAGVSGVDNLGASHRVGLHFKFGRKLSEVEAYEVRKKYETLAQKVLTKLRKKVNSNTAQFPEEVKNLAALTTKVVKRRGFANPADLYEAQGYVYFLQKDYTKSVYHIGEALNFADGSLVDLKNNYEKALSFMNKGEKEKEIARLMSEGTDYYSKKQWKPAARTFGRVLLIDPNNGEAKTLAEVANRNYQAPINKAMKQAKKYFNQQEYLKSIRWLTQVRALDPANKQAKIMVKKAIRALENMQLTPRSKDGNRVVVPVQKNTIKSREYYSMGLQFYAEGKMKDAIWAWERAIKSDKNNTSAINAYNRALSEMGRQGLKSNITNQ